MAIHQKPEFQLISDFSKKIHDEGNYGPERRNVLNQLKEWQQQNRTAMNSGSEFEKRRTLDEVYELAIKMTQCAFIPPWERG